MPTKQRGRIFVRSEDGSATVVSSRPGSITEKLCRKRRIKDLGDAVSFGLLPAFLDLDALEREVDRVRSSDAIRRDAEVRVGKNSGKGPNGRHTRDARLQQARVAWKAQALQATELATTLPTTLSASARTTLAGRAIQVVHRAPADIVRFELEEDLDVHTDLVFAADVDLATVGDLRIFRGAVLVANAASFVLHATSAKGNVLAVEAEASAGNVSLHDHLMSI